MQIGVFFVGVFCLIFFVSSILLSHAIYEKNLLIKKLEEDKENIIGSNRMYIDMTSKKEKEMKQEIISYKDKIMDFAVLNANFADHIEQYYTKGVFYDKENNTIVMFDNLDRIGEL